MPGGMRERFRPDLSERAAIDAARHRASVVAWMRAHGYRHIEPGVTALDVQLMANRANISDADLEDEVMPSTEKGERHLNAREVTTDLEAPVPPSTCEGLEWLPMGATPPPTRNGDASKYAHIAAALRAQPGRWAVVPVPRGSVQALRRRGIETVQRNHGGEHKLYARWSPPD